MITPIVTVENINKKYRNADRFSLENVSFSILEGEKFGILGPNGAGKTTLISILCGVLRQTSGHIRFGNNSNNPLAIGFVPQDFALYEELNAWQNLEYFGVFYDLTQKQIKEQSTELLSRLGLLNAADKKVKTIRN